MYFGANTPFSKASPLSESDNSGIFAMAEPS